MDIAEQSMYATIAAIKQDPSLSQEAAVAIVDSFYPGEGSMRLQLYTQAMYDVASIPENTFEALRGKIVELSIEDLGRIMPQVRIVADELLKPYVENQRLLARKAELEEMLAALPAPKTEPDQETLDFWNMVGPGLVGQDKQAELDNVIEALNQ